MASTSSKKAKKPPQGGRKVVVTARHQEMLDVLQQFRILIKSMRGHYQQIENRSGISGAQLWALAHIADHPGSKVGELAQALAIHQSTASNLLRRLESLGLVARSRLAHDQRSVELSLTAEGKSTIQRAPRPLIGVLQQALSVVPDATIAALHRHLAQLIGAMETKNTKGRLTPLSDL